MLDLTPSTTTLSTPLRTPEGVRMTDLGALWGVYSPLSGQTLVLNTEAVAMLEVLRDEPGDLAIVCRALALDAGLGPKDIEDRCRGVWQDLLDAGLLEPAPLAAA